MTVYPSFIRAHKGTVYTLEPARKGSRKLRCSAMPEKREPWMTGADFVDRPIPLRAVPLAIRRAARCELGMENNQPWRPSHV